MREWIRSWLQTPEDALNFVKISTWIVTGLVAVVVLLRIVRLFIDFKSKSKEQKITDLLSIIAGLCMIGIFWLFYVLFGVPLASGY